MAEERGFKVVNMQVVRKGAAEGKSISDIARILKVSNELIKKNLAHFAPELLPVFAEIGKAKQRAGDKKCGNRIAK